MTDWIEELGPGQFVFVILLLVLVTGCGLYSLGHMTIDQWACNAATESIGLPHRFTFWGGCQVMVSEGKWVPLENYRYIEP